MSMTDLELVVAAPGTVDLVIVAQAIHWFDLPTFYQQVQCVLKKPNGVLAAWCYTDPQANEAVDTVFWRLYTDSGPYWAPQHKLVDEKLKSIDFPFKLVDGKDDTGPMEFMTKRSMDLEGLYSSFKCKQL